MMSRSPSLPALDYGQLFSDPAMFDSREKFAAAGFTVKRRSRDDKIMIGSHPSVPGHMFKKFTRKVRCHDQRENYRERISGANAIRAVIAKHGLDHLVVANKWLYELPRAFGERRRCRDLLVVERLDLIKASESKRLYRTIDHVALAQLCRVLHTFSGFDAAVHNLKFTTAGQIAFFDTESWNQRARPFARVFRYLAEELPRKSLSFAEQLFERFDDE